MRIFILFAYRDACLRVIVHVPFLFFINWYTFISEYFASHSNNHSFWHLYPVKQYTVSVHVKYLNDEVTSYPNHVRLQRCYDTKYMTDFFKNRSNDCEVKIKQQLFGFDCFQWKYSTSKWLSAEKSQFLWHFTSSLLCKVQVLHHFGSSSQGYQRYDWEGGVSCLHCSLSPGVHWGVLPLHFPVIPLYIQLVILTEHIDNISLLHLCHHKNQLLCVKMNKNRPATSNSAVKSYSCRNGQYWLMRTWTIPLARRLPLSLCISASANDHS